MSGFPWTEHLTLREADRLTELRQRMSDHDILVHARMDQRWRIMRFFRRNPRPQQEGSVA